MNFQITADVPPVTLSLKTGDALFCTAQTTEVTINLADNSQVAGTVSDVTVSTEDRDNFVKNMVTILCEERVGLAVYRPEAFVKGDFDGLPASV